MTAGQSPLWVLYDGECPFCSRYVRLMRLRENIEVHLVDARQDSPLKQEATAAGLDLDAGMVVRYGGVLYHGAAAMTMLALLSTRSGIFNRVMAGLFGEEKRSARVYPVFAFFRGLTVRLLGRGKISNIDGR